jgi:Ca2+-binding EF-hand superfamily protein
MSQCALLTPKEINVIIRSFKADEKEFEYKLFEILLFEVRFELARSRLMDTGLDKMTAHLIEEFKKYDTKLTGTISITEIKKSLFNSKKANLTPVQVFNLIGMASPDSMGMVKYAEFSPYCTQLI